MKCPYCQQSMECLTDRIDTTGDQYASWSCSACHLLQHHRLSPGQEWRLIVEIFRDIYLHNREFEVGVYYLFGETEINRIHRDHLGTIERRQLVCGLKQAITWTPKNVKDKLKLLLPFM